MEERIVESKNDIGYFNGLNVNKLKSLLMEGFSRVKAIKKKDVVLVIGNTGAGKSTFINYALKCKMESFFCDELSKDCIKAVDPLVEIGHDIESKTLFAEVFEKPQDEDNNICWLDCPGFKDNRGKEHGVCVSVCTEMAIKMANSIRSIVVVIDFEELTAGRGAGFSELSKTLSKLLNDMESISESVFFIINKIPVNCDKSRIEKSIKNNLIPRFIKQFKDNLTERQGLANRMYEGIRGWVSQSQIRNIDVEKEKEIRDFEDGLKFFEFMNKHLDNIMLGDLLDNGHTRDSLVKKIVAAPAIPVNIFNFTRYDVSRTGFNQLVYDISDDGARILRDLESVPARMSIVQQRIENSRERAEYYNTDLRRLESGEINKDDHAERLKTLQSRLRKHNELIASYNVSISNIDDSINALRLERGNLDSADPVVYHYENMKENRELLGHFLSWTDKKFNYDGIPFVKVHKSHNTTQGDFCEEKKDESNGKYSVRYVSKRGHGSSAEVTIYVEKRCLSDNKQRIAAIDRDIVEKDSSKSQLQRDKFIAIKEAESFQVGINLILAGNAAKKEDFDREISNIKSSIRRLESDIIESEEELNTLRVILKNLITEFKGIENVLGFVYDFVNVVSYDSALINEFIKQYTKYISNRKIPKPSQSVEFDVLVNSNMSEERLVSKDKETQEDVFVRSTVLESEYVPLNDHLNSEIEPPEELCCSISTMLLVDPVVATHCGHSFERKDLSSYFQLQDSFVVDCPECRHPIRENELVTNYKLIDVIRWWKKENQVTLNFNNDTPIPKSDKELEELDIIISECDIELGSLKLKVEQLERAQSIRRSCLNEGKILLKRIHEDEDEDEEKKSNSQDISAGLISIVGQRSGSPLHEREKDDLHSNGPELKK